MLAELQVGHWNSTLTQEVEFLLITLNPHLQGRLPIRVELKGLGAAEMYRILTEPDTNMIRQQQVGDRDPGYLSPAA